MQVYEFLAGEESKDLRLDVFLKQNIEEISRTYIQKLIKDGYANVNGTVPKTVTRCVFMSQRQRSPTLWLKRCHWILSTKMTM